MQSRKHCAAAPFRSNTIRNTALPKTIKKDVRDILEITSKDTKTGKQKKLTKKERELLIQQMTKEMREAARLLEFEHAAFLRDEIQKLEEEGKRKLK